MCAWVCVWAIRCVCSPVEALHLGTLMAAHGYLFPISDHVLTLKDDGTFYRFQVRPTTKCQSTHGLCTEHYSMYRTLSTLLWQIQSALIHIGSLASCERSTKIQHQLWFFSMYRYLSWSAAYLMQLIVHWALSFCTCNLFM